MKRIDLPLSELTFSQKLELMEAIWSDLSMDEDRLESPAWHETILRDREAAFEAGKTTSSDWDEAKEIIRKRGSGGKKSSVQPRMM